MEFRKLTGLSLHRLLYCPSPEIELFEFLFLCCVWAHECRASCQPRYAGSRYARDLPFAIYQIALQFRSAICVRAGYTSFNGKE